MKDLTTNMKPKGVRMESHFTFESKIEHDEEGCRQIFEVYYFADYDKYGNCKNVDAFKVYDIDTNKEIDMKSLSEEGRLEIEYNALRHAERFF